jgi:hypothetical protein
MDVVHAIEGGELANRERGVPAKPVKILEVTIKPSAR